MATNLGRIGISSMGQLRWPTLRSFSAGCTDVNFGSVNFGGLQSHLSVILSDTWSFEPTPSFLNSWNQIPVTVTPPARYLHTLGYDSLTGFSILFGGTDGTVKSDTYQWDGADWTLQSPSTTPTARSGAASAMYNSGVLINGGGVLVWGGEDSGGTLLQSGYVWDGAAGNWIATTGSSPPSARKWHVMVKSTNLNFTTIFGGRDITGAVANTYTLSSLGAWVLRSTINSPSARQQHAASDWNGTGGTGIIMFGGDNGSGSLNAETWRLSRAGAVYTWFSLSPAHSPSARKGHTMWTDIGGNLYLMGGNNGTNDLYDIWQWTGTDWVQRF